MASDFFEAKKLNEKSFKDLDDELSAYMAQADNALEALQKGADALVKDLKALPKPRSKIVCICWTALRLRYRRTAPASWSDGASITGLSWSTEAKRWTLSLTFTRRGRRTKKSIIAS